MMVSPDQLAFSLKVWSVLTIFKARVGQMETQRWQFTQRLSSEIIIFSSSS